MKKRFLALVLALTMIMSAFTMPTSVSAKTGAETATVTEAKVQFSEITKAYKESYIKVRKEITPEYGNEWNMLIVAKSGNKGKSTDWLFNKYSTNLATTLKVNGGKLMNKDQDGKPVDAKITDYERVAIALSAIGKNPTKFYGYNLLEPIADYDAVTGVGINAVIYALLALDSGNYAMPTTKSGKQATKKMYLDYILAAELPNGGFNWGFDDAVDPDLTGMAITALAPYRKFKAVNAAIDRAVNALSEIQTDDGSMESWGSRNADSTAWVVIALTALGFDPHKDARFTKNGTPVLDALLMFYMGNGEFSWITDNTYNAYATTESVMALTAYINFAANRASLFKN